MLVHRYTVRYAGDWEHWRVLGTFDYCRDCHAGKGPLSANIAAIHIYLNNIFQVSEHLLHVIFSCMYNLLCQANIERNLVNMTSVLADWWLGCLYAGVWGRVHAGRSAVPQYSHQ